MSVGRRTPYEMVFGANEFAASEFPAIAEEAERRGLVATDLDGFAGLEAVSAMLAQVGPDEADPAALARYVDLLFHAYRFWTAGCLVYAADEPVVRSLIEAHPDLSGWKLRAQAPALYLELPKNLVWAAVDTSSPPEPLEGAFVAMTGSPSPESVYVLGVLGIRPDRAGFSVVSASARLDEARQHVEPDAFRSDIPGAELAGLYSLRSPADLLLLALYALWYVDAYPDSCQLVEGTPSDEADHTGPTALDHHRVTLVNRGRE